MTQDQRYLFDLNGYLIVKDVLSPDEVARCNSAIDRHSDQSAPMERSLAGDSPALAGTSRRRDLGGMLQWEKPWCDPFRHMLAHPGVAPCLNEILGANYRLDHGPSLISQDEGCEGCTLHHGGGEAGDFVLAYFFQNNRIFTGLTVVEYMLADEGPGNGGVAVVPGSHKANLPCPRDMKLGQLYQEHVLEVNARAGDAVIFTEALTHGTLPWKASHQRRALLYKFSPGYQAFSGGAHDIAYPDYIEEMPSEQRAVMEAPHYRR